MKASIKKVSIVMACLTILVANISSATLMDGLVGYYSFDGNANDSSSHENHGTIHGAILTEDRFGNMNSAYSFDGINDYISAGASMLPTAERTVSLWFKADSLFQPVLMGYGGGACGTSFFMGLNAAPANYQNKYYVTSHCHANLVTAPYSENPINEWIHMAVSTDVSGTSIFINGAEVAHNSLFINNTDVSGKQLAFGVDTSPSGYAPYTDGNITYFDGALDDIRIYNRALSDSEIGQLANDSGTQIPLAPTISLLGIGLLGLFRKSAR